MVNKHFFKTLALFIVMITLGLAGVFFVSNFEICKFDFSCHINQALLSIEVVV